MTNKELSVELRKFADATFDTIDSSKAALDALVMLRTWPSQMRQRMNNTEMMLLCAACLTVLLEASEQSDNSVVQAATKIINEGLSDAK